MKKYLGLIIGLALIAGITSQAQVFINGASVFAYKATTPLLDGQWPVVWTSTNDPFAVQTLIGMVAASPSAPSVSYLNSVTVTNAAQTNSVNLLKAQACAFNGDVAGLTNGYGSLSESRQMFCMAEALLVAGRNTDFVAMSTNLLANWATHTPYMCGDVLKYYVPYLQNTGATHAQVSALIYAYLAHVNKQNLWLFQQFDATTLSSADYKAWLQSLLQASPVDDAHAAYLGAVKSKLNLLN